MTDNFDLLKEFYARHPRVNDSDTFLFGQIMARKKDGASCANSNNKVIKDLVFRTPEDFDKKKVEITTLCKTFGARAYVNVNPRSYKAVALEMAGLCLDYIRRGSENAIRTAFSTTCGRSITKGGYWVIDIDDSRLVEPVSALIPTEKFAVPTVNGLHLLCKGFDTRPLRKAFCDEIDIHKNNPTLLYYGG